MDDRTVLLAVAVAVVVAVAAAVLGAVARRRSRGHGQGRGRGPAPARGAPSPSERLRRALAATAAGIRARLDAAAARGTPSGEAWLGDLEEALLAADVGVETTRMLLERARARLGDRRDAAALRLALRREVECLLAGEPPPEPRVKPWVVLVTGVNGVGKTTTVGKLAARHVAAGRRVLLVAADTFRAAAISQLAVWAERTGADLVRHAAGSDPAAVVFDGMKAALARGVDTVLIDSAGRLHTRTPLMEELRKLKRVIERELPGAPHEILLVLDATTGQNAVSQAAVFTEAVDVTGIVLTKLDGTARGGVALAIRHRLGIPIRFIGIGEGIEDLRPFDAAEFAEAMLGTATARAATCDSRDDGPSPSRGPECTGA